MKLNVKTIAIITAVIIGLGCIIAGGLYIKSISDQLKDLQAKNDALTAQMMANAIANQVDTNVGINTITIAPDVKSAVKIMNNRVYLEKQGDK